MSKFTVIYDACVLYPAPLRDTLMRLALTDLFKAHWTDDIHREWIRAVLRQGKHTEQRLERTRDLMDRHVRDAKVTGYQRDFPESALSPYGIETLHPDDFIFYQIDMAPSVCCYEIRQQRLDLKNPAITVDEFLAVLQKQQLPQTVSKLREFEALL